MRIAVACSLVLVLLGAGRAVAVSPELKTDEDKTLYALGFAVSQNLSLFGLTEAELAVVEAGISDGVLHKKPEVDLQAWGPKIQQLYAARTAKVMEAEKKAGHVFADKAVTAEGATKTPGGLVITTIKPGTGDAPKPTDTVKVHYQGTLIDGTVFDSSIQRGTPATFALNGVIKCWTEALSLMKVGGKSRIVCPSELAYGDRGSPPKIKPGATLVFDIELLEIVTK